MSILLIILSIVILIRLFNSYRIAILVLKTDNKILDLRNKLVLQAINDKKLQNNPVFNQIDYIIAKSSPEIQRTNIWVILYNIVVLRRVPTNNNKRVAEDHELQKFFDDYAAIHVNYLAKKNIFYLFLTFIIMKTTRKLSYKLSKYRALAKTEIKYDHIIGKDGFSPCC